MRRDDLVENVKKNEKEALELEEYFEERIRRIVRDELLMVDKNMTELKPCPFCLSKDVRITMADGRGYSEVWIICDNCDAEGPCVSINKSDYYKNFKTKLKAEAFVVSNWNGIIRVGSL